MIKFLKRKLGIDVLETIALSTSNDVSAIDNGLSSLVDRVELLTARIESIESQMISEDGVRVFQKTFRDKTTGESVVQKIIEQRTRI